MKTLAAVGAAAFLMLAGPSAADEDPRYYFQTSLLTRHFEPKPEHNNQQGLLNVERYWDEGLLIGGAYFRNSFNQPAQYVYVGKRYTLPYTREAFYAKITAGLLHGYKDEYQDRIPLNGYGVAPAVLPALGFRGKTLGGELIIFGTAGAMLTIGFGF
ncbi:MAG TPA: sn-glycerol-3-phosphate transporter [Burkholderiales bacterium]|nr:sn-glycerol-3-phosphate transporter [Burkholderiales bacterium]